MKNSNIQKYFENGQFFIELIRTHPNGETDAYELGSLSEEACQAMARALDQEGILDMSQLVNLALGSITPATHPCGTKENPIVRIPPDHVESEAILITRIPDQSHGSDEN